MISPDGKQAEKKNSRWIGRYGSKERREEE
jgi:hypothetical protein